MKNTYGHDARQEPTSLFAAVVMLIIALFGIGFYAGRIYRWANPDVVSTSTIELNVDPECNRGYDWEWKSMNRVPESSQVLTCLDGILKSERR